jgi:acyl-CoA reductase-like NAD-dependent aldehyde dehydrogenase
MIERWPEFLDVIVQSISANGGRSCINTSAILVPSHRDELADAIAKRLAEIKPLARDDDHALLCGFANPAMADGIDELITAHLKEPGAEDLTAKHRDGDRKAEAFDQFYLNPTLISCTNKDHPLANTEFMFPYASIVEMPQNEMVDSIGQTLVVSAITEDQTFINQLLLSPDIERLNLGPYPTNRVQWEQPHEGNLFEFLYHRRAIQGDVAVK